MVTFLSRLARPALLALGVLTSVTTLAASRPNIVFIITDDLGYGDLSCYGQENFATPEIDRLASSGLRFTQHYSGATVCAPSRCTLMTGLGNGRAYIRGNGPHALRPDPLDTTIASLLQRSGYRTAMIGKSCVTGNTQEPKQVLGKGFDVFYGTTHHVDGHWRYPRFVYDQDQRVDLPGNHLHHGTDYDGELYTRRAESFLREQETDQPFFLLLSYPLPHASVLAPPGEVPGGAGVEPGNAHYTPVREPRAHYIGMMRALDSYVGRVRSVLAEKGLERNTIIAFTSDNGSHSEGGYKPGLLRSNGPLKGGKRDLYEGGIRVPMVIHWPAGVTTPRVVEHATGFVDFLPTVCELANLPVPPDLDGVSYAPLLRGGTLAERTRPLYWESHENNGRRAMRDGRWKLVQYNLAAPADDPGQSPQLYDLESDPSETTNLASSDPERVKRMLDWMAQHRTHSDLFPYPPLDRKPSAN